ncbi:PTS glucitol/sorbitol transporter subunit IIA [Staphylococcus epidermidis]|uniref:PTS glucitol/sorbitol transporter subunit IIA n=1 Tax=Staphylococcus epidermidis TaxID=1282 RepID=UPI0021B464AA|nr:PTS glucitol/sorbitol transporter subunit IIA [Staphylococcus epidermidis]
MLFPHNPPHQLLHFSYTIHLNNLTNQISQHQYLYFHNNPYKIKKLPTSLNKNLTHLPHITLKFHPTITPQQSPTLYLQNKHIPKIQQPTLIKIQN